MWSNFETMPGEMQLALSIMPAVIAMQSQPGSMYHCPAGTKLYPYDPHESENVSNENNLSMYAGLRQLFYFLVNNTIVADPFIVQQTKDVQTVLKNLESWFFDANDGAAMFTAEELEFEGQPSSKIGTQGGHVLFGSGKYEAIGIMNYSGFAVDCQTWCMSVLIPYMPNHVTTSLGADGPYNLWQQVKARAGYFVGGDCIGGCEDGVIAGVGFTQV